MTICNDPNDQTQRNAAVLAPLPNTTASDGTLLPSFTTAALEDYTGLISADIGLASQNNTPISQFVRQYGQEAFNAGLVAINNTLVSKETFQDNLPSYPQLETRLNTQLPITPIEYANYMNEFLQTPLTVVSLVNSNPSLVQSQLNDYYRNNFTQSAIGSFCALMPSVFGAIGGFFNLVEDAQQVFQDITDFINNFSVKDFSIKAIMKKLIGQIKEQILKVVDDAVSKVKGIIENLSFENFIGQIETVVNEKIIGRFIELKAQALAFFSEENIKNLKKKVENLINYAGNIFKDPSLEEIQFLVYRFCAFAGQIENAIDLLKKPLDDFINSYQDTFQIFKSWGGVNTSEAVVTGGAIRYSDEERKRKIEQGKQKEQGQETAPPNDLTISELTAAESLKTYEAVKADSRFVLNENAYSFGLDPKLQTAQEGWEGVEAYALARLIRLQKLFGKKLTINSAFRSEKLNNFLRSKNDKVAKNSKHLKGTAFDIKWNGYPDGRDEFINLAQNKCGLLGIGVYSSFVHVDTGPRRIW
jgi:uncharacterized protein YjbJ (UPF0337 family)